MADYLWSMLTVSIFVSVALLLAPNGEKEGSGKYISFIGALIVALVMLSPLLSAINSYSFGSADVSKGSIDHRRIDTEYYANSAGLVLSEVYQIPLNSIKAEVLCNDLGEIKHIDLILGEEVIFDKDKAEEMLTNIFGFEIRVVGNDREK